MTNKFKRSKNLIKDFTFLKMIVISIMLLTSCSKDNYDSLTNDHKGIDKNKINFTQFKNETNIDQVEPILSVPTKTSIASKSKSQLSDFFIDTLDIKRHIDIDNKTTYTFRIYPLSSVAQTNDIYNLVYRKVDNKWETSIFYLKKLPKENSEHKLFEKIERIYGGKITNAITSKSSSFEMCAFEMTTYHCPAPGVCDGSGKCDLCSDCVTRMIAYKTCDGGGGSSGGGASDPGNTSGSGGGASDPYAYAPNIFDNPVFDDPNYINAINRYNVWANLGDAAQGFFADPYKPEKIQFFNQIIQYQIDNNWSQESRVFANEMINSLINSIDIDIPKRIIYDINRPCQKQIVKDILNISSPFTELIRQTFNNSDNANIKFSNEANVPGNGNTSPIYSGTPQNFIIKIKFSNTFLDNSTNLGIVATSLHELVHAYLMNLYLKGTLVATNSDYNTLQNAFITFYDNQVQDTFDPLDNEIHNAMKDFISKMANSIYNYAISKNISVTPDFCEKLAWGTMSGTDLFAEALTPAQQTENNNIYVYEQDNILPQAKGIPCN